MFKQLKRKMLILNLSLLTVLLVLVFATLYYTNYNQIQKQIDDQIIRVMNNYRDTYNGQGTLPAPIDGEDKFLPDRIVAFVIVTDLNGENVKSWFSFETDDDFSSATDLVTSNEGQFELNGSYWAYHKDILLDEVVYGFVDITNEQAYLSNMIWTFVFVFLGAFAIVYIISNYFSNRSIIKIKEAFDKQNEFIANASHELKTPLAIISTNADILIQEGRKNQWLNNIKYESDRMSQLTKNLLYLAKMSDQKHRDIVFSNVNISELVESSILGFEALVYDKNIEMTYQIQPNVITKIDDSHISQVVHILLDNAVKYTNSNGKIKIDLEKNHNQIILSVFNTGEGIAEKDIEKVFDRFYMGDESRSKNEKSYGLGLSIAKSIIESVQGKIVCSSIAGEYTKFTVKLKIK